MFESSKEIFVRAAIVFVIGFASIEKSFFLGVFRELSYVVSSGQQEGWCFDPSYIGDEYERLLSRGVCVLVGVCESFWFLLDRCDGWWGAVIA